MVSVIVISQNTPILLHSFLESLLYFSNYKKENINAQLIHRQNVRYDKVKRCFPDINYFECKDNSNNLCDLISSIKNEYVMICSDNMVIKNKIDVNDFKSELEKEELYYDTNCIIAKTSMIKNIINSKKFVYAEQLFEYYNNLTNDIKHSDYFIEKICINIKPDNFELTELLAYLFNIKNIRIDFNKLINRYKNNDSVDIKELDIFPKNKISFAKRLKNLVKKIIGKDKVVIKKVDEEVHKKTSDEKIPKILTPEESIDLLLKAPKSMARLGDNELLVINKEDATFQKYDPKLRDYLIEVLKNENDDIYSAIPYIYYHPDNLVDTVHNFQNDFGKKLNAIISQHCSYTNAYFDTAMSQAYQIYKDYDFDNFFNKAKQLFANKKISLVIGEGIYQKFEHSIFEQCSDFEIIEAPKFDAFSKLDYLMDEIGKREKDRIICVILGPAAKALTIEMTKRGYMVWDIGHLAKDYNAYAKQMPRTSDKVLDFFAPD